MKKLKANILLFSLISCSLGMSAQTKIGYNYDAAGNRVKRELVLSRSQSQESKRSVAYSDVLGDHQIQIVPNSKSGKVKVAALDGKLQFSVMVYNVSGQNVQTLKDVRGQAEVDLSNNPNGIYVLVLEVGQEKTTWKIMKTN